MVQGHGHDIIVVRVNRGGYRTVVIHSPVVFAEVAFGEVA